MNKEKEVIDKLIELTENDKLYWHDGDNGYSTTLPVKTGTEKTIGRVNNVMVYYPNPAVEINGIEVVENVVLCKSLIQNIRIAINLRTNNQRDNIINELLAL